MRFAAACLLIASAAIASTLHVPAEYPSIQDAIDSAVDGDTVLVGPGTYHGIDFLGKDIAVISEQGPGSAVIGSGPYYESYGNVQFLNGETSAAILEGFEISGGHRGVFIQDCSPVVRGNVITNNTLGAIYGAGIYVSGPSPTIENNLILDNNAIGGTYSAFGGGIFCHDGSAQIHNNVIACNVSFCGAGVTCSGGGHPVFTNDTIVYNTIVDLWGGAFHLYYDPDTYVTVRNCILWGNLYDEAVVEAGTLDISWSDVGGGQDSIDVWGGGRLVWGEGNIDADPLFFAGPMSDYHLDTETSPCIDAGDPSPAYYDPEDPANPGYALWPALGTIRNDMGAYGGQGVCYWVGITEEPAPPAGEASLAAFPNPFSLMTAVIFQLPEPGMAALQVFDAAGRLVETLTDGEFDTDSHAEVFYASDLPSGVYLCRLQAGASSATARVVLIR